MISKKTKTIFLSTLEVGHDHSRKAVATTPSDIRD